MKVFMIMLVCSLMILSCEVDDTGIESDFYYPMKIGNSWEYLRSIELTNIIPDSIPPELLPAYDSSLVSVWISGNQILNDSIETIVCKASENSSPDHSVNYYLNKPDGLYNIAYKNVGATPVIIPKTTQKFQIRFMNKMYNNIYEIIKEMEINDRLFLSKIADDSLYFEDFPTLSLKYPLSIGSQWTFRNIPFRIDKHVLDQVTVSAAGKKFECYQIKWIYDINNNGEWDDHMYIYDYIAAQGLIQRDINVIGSYLVDIEGNDLGSFDFHDRMLLQSYDIQ